MEKIMLKNKYISKLTRSRVNKLFDAKNHKYSNTIVRDLADKYKGNYFIMAKNIC